MEYLKITWKRSAIGRNRKQRRIIESLGLRRLNQTVVQPNTPSIQGMVKKTIHMLHVEQFEALNDEAQPVEAETESESETAESDKEL